MNHWDAVWLSDCFVLFRYASESFLKRAAVMPGNERSYTQK
jgi:hypothetical protein